ncbi:STAS domain-containing protein [Streptomyces sp. NPDC046716]|uniref:STAS domain-containing protein n=1 Tax=Streptomyces sp. NPDC046716 TaxID=3157093 RepID=UPI0033DC8AA2
MLEDNAWPVGHIRVRETHGIIVIELHGEIDIAGTLDALPSLDAATSDEGRTVLLDLGPVTFFDVYSLRLLCRAQDRVVARGGRLLVVCAQRNILKLLRVAGLLDRFDPLPTVTEAMERGAREAAG